MLRWNAHPGGELIERLPREEVPVDVHGRRLKSGGVLSGALHTLGYYSTDVCLGNPGRRFDLIVDTGSSITAVPCSTCKQCGMHHCGRTGCFDIGRSLSVQTLSCKRPPSGFSCERCYSGEKCGYSVHYTEGSSIQGHVVTDYAHFMRSKRVLSVDDADSGGGATSLALSTRVYFGCQTLETGMFFKQEADGIMGMQPPRARSRVPSMLSSLVTQRGAIETFSLCLADRSGLFLLGGRPGYSSMRRLSALTVPMERGARARYTLSLKEVRVSGSGSANGTFRPLNLPASTYAPTLVDSGTTFVYASTPLFHAIHAHVRQHTPSLTREGGKVCAFLTQAQLDSMPSLQLVFGAVPSQPLLVRPRQYMVEFPKAGMRTAAHRHYCVAVFDNQRGGTVIGASIMRQREVIFDIAGSTISFVNADCTSITPATSHLVDAYSFAPCPPRNATNNPSASGAGGGGGGGGWLAQGLASARSFASGAGWSSARAAGASENGKGAMGGQSAGAHSASSPNRVGRLLPGGGGRSTLRSVMRSRGRAGVGRGGNGYS